MTSEVLVIDNYDSFVYILVQYLGELGVEPLVYRHDQISLEESVLVLVLPMMQVFQIL